MQPVTIEYKGYVITTDKNLLQPEQIHEWLSSKSYWSKNIPWETVKLSFDNSFCIGVLQQGRQVGYARMITDYATFAYLADVYVEEKHRGHGLSKKMMEMVMEQGWVKGLRKLLLATLDAHALYEQYGFVKPSFPDRYMEISRPAIYGDGKNVC